MKRYLMLQNARFTAFTASELLRENQWRREIKVNGYTAIASEAIEQ